jgi:DHA2 family multidrug resistance protein
LHRADLITNIYPGNPAFDERYKLLIGGFMSRGEALAQAQQHAMAIINGQLMKQAAMLSYNDCWHFILGCFLVVIPAVFLLHKPSKRMGPPIDAH